MNFYEKGCWKFLRSCWIYFDHGYCQLTCNFWGKTLLLLDLTKEWTGSYWQSFWFSFWSIWFSPWWGSRSCWLEKWFPFWVWKATWKRRQVWFSEVFTYIFQDCCSRLRSWCLFWVWWVWKCSLYFFIIGFSSYFYTEFKNYNQFSVINLRISQYQLSNLKIIQLFHLFLFQYRVRNQIPTPPLGRQNGRHIEFVHPQTQLQFDLEWTRYDDLHDRNTQSPNRFCNNQDWGCSKSGSRPLHPKLLARHYRTHLAVGNIPDDLLSPWEKSRSARNP